MTKIKIYPIYTLGVRPTWRVGPVDLVTPVSMAVLPLGEHGCGLPTVHPKFQERLSCGTSTMPHDASSTSAINLTEGSIVLESSCFRKINFLVGRQCIIPCTGLEYPFVFCVKSELISADQQDFGVSTRSTWSKARIISSKQYARIWWSEIV